MLPAFSPFLALRYLMTRRINVLGVLGVAFAVWAMLIVDGVFTGFVTDIHTDVRASAPELLLTDLPHDTGYGPLRDALEADQDVVTTAPRLRHHGLLQPVRGNRYAGEARSSQLEFEQARTSNGFAVLLGIDPLREPQVVDIEAWLDRGPQQIERRGRRDPRAVVFDEKDERRLAELRVPDELEWQARGRAALPREPDEQDHVSLWPGMLLGWPRVFANPRAEAGDPFDVLVVAFPREDADGAVMRPHTTRMAFAGWFSAGSRMFDETTVLVPIETLRTMLGHDAYDPNSVELVTDVAIRPRAGLTAPQLQALQLRLQQRAQQVLPEGSPPCAVLDWRQQNQTFLSAVAQEQAMMEIVLFVVMLVSAFVIYTTLHMMVTQKVKDIGIVAAVGGAPGGIGGVFLIGGTVVAIVGTLLGVVAGLLSSIWLNPVNDWLYATFGVELFPRGLFDLDEVPCHIEPGWVVTVAVGAVLLAVVVATVPARKAARMNPVTALSFE
ncbi:MAG: FtsX-like permease family protein [Planctomycetes bacterium]|nr:FtsX-like permease family protein [Planctomycetota bacterium]